MEWREEAPEQIIRPQGHLSSQLKFPQMTRACAKVKGQLSMVPAQSCSANELARVQAACLMQGGK